MSLHRRAAKRDDSEPEIVEAFLDAGATVIKHSGVDESDLVIGYRGRNHLVECKTGNGLLSEGQKKWIAQWGGERPEVCRNAAQARKLIRVWNLEADSSGNVEDDMDKVEPKAWVG